MFSHWIRSFGVIRVLLTLSISLAVLPGCGKGRDTGTKQGDGIKVRAPGVDVDVNEKGVDVKAPGVDVNVDKEGVDVNAPDADVNVDKKGVQVETK